MKNIIKMNNISIYIKLLGIFISVVAPVYLIGLFANISSANYARDDIQKFMADQLSQVVESMDHEIETVNSSLREFSVNTDLLRYSEASEGHEEYENQMRMDRIRTQLLFIRNINSVIQGEKLVHDAKIYILGRKKVISASNLIEEMNMEEYNRQKSLFTHSYSRPIYWNRKLLFNMYYPMLLSDEDPLYVLSIEISEDYLKKKFAGINGDRKSHLYIADSDGTWFVTDMERKTGESNEIAGYLQNLTFEKGETFQSIIEINQQKVLLTIRKSAVYDMLYVYYIPQKEVFSSLSRYNHWLLLISLLTLIIMAVFAFWVHRLIERPLNKFKGAFTELENGNLDIAMSRKSNDEFGYLYNQFNKTVANLKQLILEIYEEKIHTQQAELKQLQYQINPHFLYNSIYIIYRLAKKQDYDSIVKLSSHLGDFYKTITKTSGEEITLKKEVKHIQDYAAIQDIRFDGRIRSAISEVPLEMKNILIPKLCIQPLVENVYEHGLRNKLEDGVLMVDFECNDSSYSIIIEDNGNETSEEDIEKLQARLDDLEPSEYSGITNVHKRLKIKYGGNSGLSLSRSELGGLKLVINIDRGTRANV